VIDGRPDDVFVVPFGPIRVSIANPDRRFGPFGEILFIGGGIKINQPPGGHGGFWFFSFSDELTSFGSPLFFPLSNMVVYFYISSGKLESGIGEIRLFSPPAINCECLMPN
jgi:hypothetical protein